MASATRLCEQSRRSDYERSHNLPRQTDDCIEQTAAETLSRREQRCDSLVAGLRPAVGPVMKDRKRVRLEASGNGLVSGPSSLDLRRAAPPANRTLCVSAPLRLVPQFRRDLELQRHAALPSFDVLGEHLNDFIPMPVSESRRVRRQDHVLRLPETMIGR